MWGLGHQCFIHGFCGYTVGTGLYEASTGFFSGALQGFDIVVGVRSPNPSRSKPQIVCRSLGPKP